MNRQTHKQTDRRTDRQTNRQTNRQPNRKDEQRQKKKKEQVKKNRMNSWLSRCSTARGFRTGSCLVGSANIKARKSVVGVS